MDSAGTTKDFQADVIARLRNCDITPTQQRIRLAQILFAKDQHVSAEQLLSIVNKDGGKVSKATIYNTLGLFAQKGLLREVTIDPSKVFYDSNLEKHHHIYHVDTGTLEDIPANEIKISQLPKLPSGAVLEDVDVIIRLRNS